MRKIIEYILIIVSINAVSQTTFRDNFIGKYNCLVKIHGTTQTGYQNRFLYVSVDTVYPNRIILTDSLWNPYQLILPVNLYIDSTYRDTIWSASGGLFFGHFYFLDSIYFHRAVPLGPGGGILMEYFGKKMANTNITENNLEKSLIIFPNPSNKQIAVDFKKMVTVIDYQVLNSEGQLIQKEEKKITTTRFSINTEKWMEGVYFITIILNEGILKKKIVIER